MHLFLFLTVWIGYFTRIAVLLLERYVHNIEHSQVLQLQLEYMLIELQWALDRTLTCNSIIMC